MLGDSNSGNGIHLQNLIIDIYRNCFGRVYIVSPSINDDHTWLPVKAYLNTSIQLSEDEPESSYNHYDAESLQSILDAQRKIIEPTI